MVASPRSYGIPSVGTSPIPNFIALAGGSAPDHLNLPLHERYPKFPGLTHEVLPDSLPDRRNAFTISEAALTRLVAPTSSKSRGASSGASPSLFLLVYEDAYDASMAYCSGAQCAAATPATLRDV